MKSFKQPENLACERAVLSSLIKFGKNAYTIVSDILVTDCFTDSNNMIIYKCVSSLLDKVDVVDIPSLMAIGTQLGYAETIQNKENADYIRSLVNFPSELATVRENAICLKKLMLAREYQNITKTVYTKLSSVTGAEKFSDILSMVEEPILNFGLGIDEDSEKTQKIGENILDYFNVWENSDNSIQGIPSPIAAYNDAIGGGRRRGGIYLTAARPKSFKSQTALNDALFVSKFGIPVLLLDTEMSEEGQLPRLIASLSNVDINDIETGKFAKDNYLKNKVLQECNFVKNLPLYYRRVAGKPFGEILSIMLRFIKENVGMKDGRTGDCLIIYDYFKLMDPSSLKDMQEYQAMGFQISALSDFCNKYEVPVSAYVQLNRQDDISQSDRLLWLCSSFSYLQRKTKEEMMLDGPQNGNVKLYVTSSQRFGGGLDDGDYINLCVTGSRAIVKEGLLKSELAKRNKDSGFELIDNDSSTANDDIINDDDFSGFDKGYRDDEYRK